MAEQNDFDYINRTLMLHDEKLNKLIEIATSLSRIEERSINQHDMIGRVIDRLDNIETRTEQIELLAAQMKGGSRATQAIGALVIAIGSALATWFNMGQPTGH